VVFVILVLFVFLSITLQPMSEAMDERVLEEFVGLLSPLLRALEVLGFLARHFDPGQLPQLAEVAAGADVALRSAAARLSDWPEHLADVRAAAEAAAGEALAAFDGLTLAFETGELGEAFRALRHVSRAQEGLYPLAGLAPVSRFFLEPSARDDEAVLARLAVAPRPGETGVIHVENERGQRGGYSLYAPEDYAADRDWPVVFALHGGSGHGRAFLWSWLRAARTLGAIVVAPTSTGPTWALTGPDEDSPNLAEILQHVEGRWRIDPQRRLLTGMSDGGTFAYVSGLEAGSPFTHLAPVAASFHPMLADYADPDRLAGLPIHIVHGLMDWMFPVEIAREARRALTRAGAAVAYTEIEDLSHTYPTEQSAALLGWMDTTAG
jgi:phospholipase/carboxylesterase